MPGVLLVVILMHAASSNKGNIRLHCFVHFPAQWIDASRFEGALLSSNGPHGPSTFDVTFQFPTGCKEMVDAAIRLPSLVNQLTSTTRRVHPETHGNARSSQLVTRMTDRWWLLSSSLSFSLKEGADGRHRCHHASKRADMLVSRMTSGLAGSSPLRHLAQLRRHSSAALITRFGKRHSGDINPLT